MSQWRTMRRGTLWRHVRSFANLNIISFSGVSNHFFVLNRCQCPSGYDGPRCQQTTRTFRGSGWAWYPALEMCENSHLSIEFLAKKPDGTLLYNGPMVPPESEETLISGRSSFVCHL